jgi:hypothetical protein
LAALSQALIHGLGKTFSFSEILENARSTSGFLSFPLSGNEAASVPFKSPDVDSPAFSRILVEIEDG